MVPLAALYLDTLRGLVAPRRLVPISLVAFPLLLSQFWFTHGNQVATLAAVVLLLTFVLTGPFLYRALLPEPPAPRRLLPLRVVGFSAAAVIIVATLAALPDLVGLGPSYLAAPVNLLVGVALYISGSWGLARDIRHEAAYERERARAEAKARQADHAALLAVRTHLDPHFLFNTLNAIAEWCREDPEIAERAILRLSGLLRAIMAGVRVETWPLTRELDLVRAVWELHAIRDPDRYRHDWFEGPVPEIEVPPLVLLPLAENAVKHGPGAGLDGPLACAVAAGGDTVAIELSNPGAFAGPRDGGEGLDLVRRRLALVYPDRASLEVVTQSTRTVATVRLPTGP